MYSELQETEKRINYGTAAGKTIYKVDVGNLVWVQVI